MNQNNLISYMKEVKHTVLIRAIVNPQLPDFPSDHIGIWPFEIRPLFLQELQVRGHLRPRLLVKSIKEFIDGRIASFGSEEDEIEQERLRATLLLYINIDVMSSSSFSLWIQTFIYVLLRA